MTTLFRAVCFDHDGTLVDSEPIHYRLWQAVLEPYGIALTEAQYKERYAGVPTLANAQDFVARYRLPVSADALSEQKQEAMRAYVARAAFPLLPNVREAVAGLHARGLRLAVVTGALRVSVGTTLREHDLGGWFDVLVCAEDVARNKPAPDCYRLAAQRLGLDPAQCVAIEDTAAGVTAAAAAGVPVVAVPHALSRLHDFSRAVAVFDTLTEAAAWIEDRSALRAGAQGATTASSGA
ncbi:MAG: HAD family phosphatase [Burkholderiales bacterium]|nr:HAD family phosphatase [Burkholderiales bacterium]